MNAAAQAREFVVVTIFPEMFPGPLGFGIVGKGIERGLLRLSVKNLRDWADPPHRQVDDATFGGGAGMVLKPEPLFRAVDSIRAEAPEAKTRVVLLDPGGRRFSQQVAQELAGYDRLVMICGRYEGVDGRVREKLVDEEISIGDYVLPGGEIPAMAIVETVARLIPNVVGEPASVAAESFEDSRLDHPHYTRPAQYRGMSVPEVLLSGNHAAIDAWRRQTAMERTSRHRPDLLKNQSPVPSEAGGLEAKER